MVEPSGQRLDIKLKPTKIPKKSKKIYGNVFIRKLGRFNHLYQLDGLYIVSIHIQRDVFSWIDRNINEIQTRKWNEDDVCSNQNTLF